MHKFQRQLLHHGFLQIQCEIIQNEVQIMSAIYNHKALEFCINQLIISLCKYGGFEKDDFEKLSTYDLKSFKYYVAGGYVNIEVKEKKQTILRQVMNCIK